MRNALLVLLLSACTPEQVIFGDADPVGTTDPGAIQGRVCSPSGEYWLEDALAYVNITDDTGVIVDVKSTTSDEDGRFLLDELQGDKEYTLYVQYGSQVLDTETVTVEYGTTTELEEPKCFDPRYVNVGLITGDYDDIQLVLEKMGFEAYTLIDGVDTNNLTAFLSDIDAMKQFDVIFFNGGHTEQGVIYDGLKSDDIIANIKQFVADGGSIYASDWSYDVVELAWPEAVDFLGDDEVRDAAQLGEHELVTATISDGSLANYLGKESVDISYDLPVWPPIEEVEGYVSVHLTGTVHYREGETVSTLPAVPLLVSFSGGLGRVGFATFRVAANQDDDTVRILEYMMKSL